MMMRSLCRLVLLLLCVNHAAAFESPEHKQLADLSYHLATQIFCATNPRVDFCLLKDEEKTFFDPVGNAVEAQHSTATPYSHISYGDIVMCVDYFLTPEKLLAGRENQLILARPKGDARARHGQLFPERRSDLEFRYWQRCDPADSNFEGARAGHVNHSHFQAELLAAQRTNHLLALMLRASDGNLFGAMVANAISDHFLQDSFAPGHITTWRSRLSDIAANAYHDRNNQRGWTIAVDKTVLADTTSIPNASHGVNLIGTILQSLCEDLAVRQYFFRYIGESPKPCAADCAVLAQSEDKRLDKLLEFMRRVHGKEELKVKLRGDQHLWDADQDEQRLVMLWTEVRAIFDVLESQSSEAGTAGAGAVRAIVLKDSFSKSAWTWDFDPPPQPAEEVFYPIKPSKITAVIGPITYVIPERNRRSGDLDDDRTWIDYKAMDQIWGVSYGIDNMTFGDTQNRKLLTLETVVQGKASHERFSENYALLAGLQGYFGPGRDGIALSSRLAWVRPETETALSVQLRALRLARDGLPAAWRPSLGGRIDLGFSSFLTAYLQGSRDAAVQRNGSIRGGWSIGAGVQLGAPTCRIPLVKRIDQCR